MADDVKIIDHGIFVKKSGNTKYIINPDLSNATVTTDNGKSYTTLNNALSSLDLAMDHPTIVEGLDKITDESKDGIYFVGNTTETYTEEEIANLYSNNISYKLITDTDRNAYKVISEQTNANRYLEHTKLYITDNTSLYFPTDVTYPLYFTSDLTDDKTKCIQKCIDSNNTEYVRTNTGTKDDSGKITWTFGEWKTIGGGSNSSSFTVYPNAGSHNSLYRGKDLTDYFNSGDMSKAISAGTFDDIFPGDYILKATTIDDKDTYTNKWVVGGLNSLAYSYTKNANHVVMIPDTIIIDSIMNGSSDSTNVAGYINTSMWKNTMPLCATGIVNAFGSEHVLVHKELLSESVNSDIYSMAGMGLKGSANKSSWVDVTCNLMTEMMVFGSLIWTSCAGEAKNISTQLPAFKYNTELMFAGGNSYWLRSVAYSDGFTVVNGMQGLASADDVVTTYGVRPYFLLY